MLCVAGLPPIITSHAQLNGELGAHDPSTLVKDGSNYYYYATGQGIISRTSGNRVSWSVGQSVFASAPAWTTQAVPSFTGFFWAPDVAYFNGKYHLYYSVSSWGTIDSAIGVATSPSLSSPTWTDLGKVVQSDAAWEAGPSTDTTDYNAIDPGILQDTDGKVWMTFGSYSSGILVTQINPSTGKRMNTGALDATLVANNALGGGWGSSIEGSELIKRGGYYYLFVNYGGCCAGVDSTYNIRVGRSTSPTGPFVDRNGVDMRNGGGSMFLDDDGKMIGPGHFSYYTEAGQDYFGYHYYNADVNGAPNFGLRNLFWTSDNWPSYAVVNPDWSGAVDGNWSSVGNWSVGGSPNGVGHTANFVSTASGRYVVSLDGGGKTVSSVNFRSPASFTIGATGGNTLTLDAPSGDSATINVAEGNHTIASPLVATDNLAINITPSDRTLTLGGSVSAPMLIKYGHGTVALGSTTSIAGSVFVRRGTVDLTGSMNTSAYTSVGPSAGDNGTLTVRGTALFSATADLNIGDTGDGSTAASGTLLVKDDARINVSSGGLFIGSGFNGNTRAAGNVYQSGGTVLVTNSGDGFFIIGGRGSSLAAGTYNLSGGSIVANTNLRVGGYGTGQLVQTGGVVNSSSYISVGRFAGAQGIYSISAGTLNQTNTSRSLIIGESGAGTLTVAGSAAINLSGALRLGFASAGAGTVNLDGGTLTTPSVVRGPGTGTLYLNGGVLRAPSASTSFISNLTGAFVKSGGAVIDTQSFGITVSQALLHHAALGSTADGGLTKLGNGTLTLTGSNTYTGSTTVNAGTLSLAVAAFTPIVGTGASGAILNGGLLQMNYTAGGSPKSLLVNDPVIGIKANASNPANGRLRTTLPIDSTMAIGWLDDGTSTFLARYTRRGDINLDGLVNSIDFNAFTAGYGMTAAEWGNGDFNYDSKVSSIDFNHLAGNFGLGQAVASEFSPGSVVPEPSMAGLALLSLASLKRRTRGDVVQ
jgi:arabinan endo-1,5-alpha-L-arabinosidase